jgi:endonuclease/exonuclease/phosphatase (EEP) superfamily protein YafD
MRLPNGSVVLVTSVRFIPPEGRLDLWNPAAWRASVANRQVRRVQLQAAIERDSSQNALPEIFGGDFNTPVPDAVFRLLTRFSDAHSKAGRGWGNTAVNNLPIARPDQIWLKGFKAVSVRARRTINSDHRAVIADVETQP